MKSINKVILLGRLGANPTRRETKNGLAVVHFPLATSRFTGEQGGQDGENRKEETLWHRVVVWGKLGEACAERVKKGETVYVEGSIRSHRYTKDGVSHTAFEVHAQEISFLGGRTKLPEDGHDTVTEESLQEAI